MPDGMYNLGNIVVSVTGRDAGHSYVILGWHKPGTLLVADGRGRKVSNPKRKNIKHVRRLDAIANKAVDALAGGLAITDEDIRQDLAPYRGDQIS